MVIFSPRVDTYQYSVTRFALIRLRVNRAGGSERLSASLYHPFIQCHDLLWRRVSEDRNASISPPTSSILHHKPAFKIALIARLRRRMSD